MNKTCADCICEDVCKIRHFPSMFGLTGADCGHFKDKSRYIELPCDKGDVLRYDGVDYKVNHWNILATSFSKDNKLHLFDIKEAKKALKGGE